MSGARVVMYCGVRVCVCMRVYVCMRMRVHVLTITHIQSEYARHTYTHIPKYTCTCTFTEVPFICLASRGVDLAGQDAPLKCEKMYINAAEHANEQREQGE